MDREKLIAMLMQQEYVSGEWISAQLGVTRAGVWKAIEGLRREGYAIESAPRRGYHIAPPKDAVWPSLIRKHLNTAWAGQRIDYYDQAGSTNQIARELGEQDASLAPHGTLVVADEQTAGRGRMDRTWQSRPGSAALMSLLLRPRALPPVEATNIVLIAALAVCDACHSFGADAAIKWPNDIVCGGKKLCGMLLDMSADMDLVRFAVVGVGLNIADYPHDPALTHVTCLNDAAGRPLERAEVIARFLASFERWYDLWSLNGPHAILAPYTERCVTVGSRVRVVGLKDDFEGEALRVTPDGSLVVMTDAGEETVVRAGDVSVRGVMGYV